jgi:hypothetical protein
MEGFWTRHIARSRETSSYGEREDADCTVKTVYFKVSPMRGL